MSAQTKKKRIAELKRDARRYIIPHFANYELLTREPKIFVKGEGCYLWDIEGNKYLDTFASLLTTIIGHGRKEIAAVAENQMKQLEFFPNYVDTYTVPLVELAKKLAEITPGDLSVSFFVNSGSEANETALKIARQYHIEKGRPHRYKFIARRDSYHATTLGGSSVTGLKWFREYFEPLLPGCIFVSAARERDCPPGMSSKAYGRKLLTELEKVIEDESPDSIAGMIMDPLPGSNTAYPLPPEGYLKGIRNLCNKYGIVLIFDEIQTGFGKTGKWFFCEHEGVTPDIMTLGKGLTGGYLPLGVTITTPKIYKVFEAPGSELRSGSTYGGHTTACATTLANINIIEKEHLVEKAAKTGEYIKDNLARLSGRHSCIGSIQGIGMLLAVELVADREKNKPFDPKLKVGNWVRDYCWKNGMILRNNGDILVIAPALNINRESVDFMLDLIDKSLTAAVKHFKL
ncbi:MAG: aspartate aminotransferase family protein [Candidatus Omnitrophota bacterium]